MDAGSGNSSVGSTAPSTDSVTPTEIVVTAGGFALRLCWPGGAEAHLPSRRLRESCRCAHCLAAARSGRPVSAPADITIRDVQPCGANAVNIVFSDGHGRGIYPFAYLAALAAQRAAAHA